MKKWIACLLAALLALSVAGCGDEPQQAFIPGGGGSDISDQAAGEATKNGSGEDTKTVNIPRSDFPIWQGPGYDSQMVATVEEPGVYTVVTQIRDTEGNLWGKLESGTGWVDLTLIQQEYEIPPVISANFANTFQIKDDNCYYCEAYASEESDRVALYVYETVTDVTFFSMKFEETWGPDEELYYIETWEPGKPLVADVLFPGDMSMYGIKFTEQDGSQSFYTISISGRNGSLVLEQA